MHGPTVDYMKVIVQELPKRRTAVRPVRELVCRCGITFEPPRGTTLTTTTSRCVTNAPTAIRRIAEAMGLEARAAHPWGGLASNGLVFPPKRRRPAGPRTCSEAGSFPATGASSHGRGAEPIPGTPGLRPGAHAPVGLPRQLLVTTRVTHKSLQLATPSLPQLGLANDQSPDAARGLAHVVGELVR
jgi:hypothetical protein